MPKPPNEGAALAIAPAAWAEMLRHCRAERPREACGVLAGDAEGVRSAWPVRNDADDPERGFLMAAGLPAVLRAIRTAGWQALGHYHSHPAASAVPSAEDRRRLGGSLPQVIVGFVPQEETRCFRGPALAKELALVPRAHANGAKDCRK